MRGKKRPLNERARAVGIATLAGGAEASRQTGIPEQSINDWMHSKEFGELRSRTKDQVVDEWWAIVQEGFRRVRELLGNAEDVQKVATATAIITDKMLLLRGEATSRTENVSLTDGLNDHEREALSDAILGELARRADTGTEGVAVGAAGATGATTAAG